MTETPQKINDGGPAFPREGGQHPWCQAEPQEGMSTRMWLAANATDADVTSFISETSNDVGAHRAAARICARYRYADAMISASRKEQSA